MHKARHTAGQRVLDATGNLNADQKLLGHASIETTGDVYADWDVANSWRRWRTSCARRRGRVSDNAGRFRRERRNTPR